MDKFLPFYLFLFSNASKEHVASVKSKKGIKAQNHYRLLDLAKTEDWQA